MQAGQTVRIIAADGAVRSLRVSGEGRNLDGSQTVTSGGVIVLYATPATVASLSRTPGYDELFFTLADTRPAAVTATIAAIRRTLAAVPGFTGFSDLPQTRAAGDWPGKSRFQDASKFLYVITLLALLSALVLISNTMTTLVAEQTPEIGIMKAVGGRRRQIAAVYLKTALLLGGLGTVAGIVLGAVLAYVLTRFLGSALFAVGVGFGVDWPIVLASALVGLLGPPLAALPAIRRAVRVPVREALEATGSAVGGQDAGDRLLRRVRFLPRPAQIGLRNVGRRRRRSLSTALVIALAVGTVLAVLGMSTAVANASRGSWGDHGEDFKIVPVGGRLLDARAAALIRATPGVADVEPMFVTDVKLDGKDARIWAVQQATMFHYRLAAGRWFTPAEEQTRAHVAIVESDIAQATGTRLGDSITVQTASGPASFRVIGISPQPAGKRHRAVRAADHDARDHDQQARRRQRILGPDHLTRPRVHRPHHDPHRRHAHGARLRRQQRDRVRQAGGRDRQQPHLDHQPRRGRPARRRDQHGRPGQRTHHERPGTHPRDRHPPLDRRPRP